MGNFSKFETEIGLMTKTIVKYQSEFDKKVNFIGLQDAIDAIDKAMVGYEGKAKRRLDQVRDLNSEARHKYRSCVGEVFEWCVTASGSFKAIHPHICRTDISGKDLSAIYTMIDKTLSSGLDKIQISLDLLKDVLEKASKLKNLFDSIMHDVHDDFGPNGFYGKQQLKLKEASSNSHNLRNFCIYATITTIFTVLGYLVFGPIGAGIGLGIGLAAYGVHSLADWNKKKDLKEQLKVIQVIFEEITDKIADAKETVTEMIKFLIEDQTNLTQLKGNVRSSIEVKDLLHCGPDLRKSFADNLKDLQGHCQKYIEWHGWNTLSYNQ